MFTSVGMVFKPAFLVAAVSGDETAFRPGQAAFQQFGGCDLYYAILLPTSNIIARFTDTSLPVNALSYFLDALRGVSTSSLPPLIYDTYALSAHISPVLSQINVSRYDA